MKKSGLGFAIAAVAALTLVSSTPAYAVPTTVTFTGSGGSSGTALFDWTTAGVLDITLTNTSNVQDISQVLDGLAFTATGGSGFTLASVSPSGGLLDCSSSTNTVSTCVPTTGTSPYGYTVATVSGTEDLFAGAGSWKPDGIVNTSIETNANLDGLRNSEHNPYLLGSTLFVLDYTGTITNVTSANFYFGTTPLIVPGTPGTGPGTGSSTSNGGAAVPEPASLALLGSGLAIAAARFRRKSKKA